MARLCGRVCLPKPWPAHQYLTHYRLKAQYEDLLSRCACRGVRAGLVDQFSATC